MGRTLAIIALASAVYAALSAILLSGPVLLVLPVFAAIAAAVFCLLERSRAGVITGIVLILYSLFAILAVFGGVSTEGAGVGNFSAATGHTASIAAGMLAVAAFVAMRWDEVDPDWLRYVSAGLALLTILLAFILADDLGSVTTTAALVALPALLAGAAPAWQFKP